jgi:hypothetical protein
MSTKLKTKAKALGMTMPEYLKHLANENPKLVMMGMAAGVRYESIWAALKQYGVTRHRAGSFEFMGVIETFRGHCRRFGLKHGTVQNKADRMGWSKTESLNHYIERVKQHD